MIDLVTVLTVIGIALMWVLIHLQHQRSLARRASCQNQLRNIGVAMFHYHNTHKHLPIQGTGIKGTGTHNETSGKADEGEAGPNGAGGRGGGNNGKRLSFLVAILPQLDQQDLWETIGQPSSRTMNGELAPGSTWNAMGTRSMNDND